MRQRVPRAARRTTRPAGPRPTGRHDPGGRGAFGDLHPGAWLAIVAALAAVAWFTVGAAIEPAPSPADLLAYILQVVPAISAILLPAAVLARHPGAADRPSPLLLGTTLFAVVQGLLILAGPLQPLFEALTPVPDDLPFLVPSAAIYDGLTLLVTSVGILAIGRGLALAAPASRRGSLPIEAIVPVTAVVVTIMTVVAAGSLPVEGAVPTLSVAFVAINGGLGILRALAWAYLVTAALRGWRGRAEPVIGWRLAASGGMAILVGLGLINLAGAIAVDPDAISPVYAWFVVGLLAAGHLALLAAFALGLPSAAGADDRDGPDARAAMWDRA